jgi:hypothetical protein
LFPLVKEIGATGSKDDRRVRVHARRIGEISTYLVISPKGSILVLAFMYSFLVASESDEERLATEALALIEDEIAMSMANAERERHFECAAGGWREVGNPRW